MNNLLQTILIVHDFSLSLLIQFHNSLIFCSELMEFENAKSTLWEAVNLDQRGFVNQALVKYTLGIEGLLQCLTGIICYFSCCNSQKPFLEFEEPRRNALTRQIEQYMSRAETLKSKQMIRVEFLEQRKIAEDSIGKFASNWV